MSDFSPMMRRIRDGKTPKINIPRKGRIRFLMLLLLIGSTFKIGTQILDTGVKSEPAVTETPNVQSKIVVDSTVKKHKKEKVSTLNYSEIVSALQNSTLNLSSNTHFVPYGKDTLTYHLSLDSSLQKLGVTLMKRYKPLYGAVIAMHPNSGRVLSIITFKNDSVADLGNLYGRSIFPAASVFKTITAAAAIESANYSSASQVKHVGRNHTLYKFQLEKELKEFNELSLEKAYALSINPVFARIGIYDLGKQTLQQFSKKFGFNTEIPFEIEIEKSHASSPDSLFELAELASGFNQQTTISPLHGALLASAISEKGRMPKPFIVDSVTRNDSTIYKAKREMWKNPISERTATELRKMMSGVSSYGTARKSFKYIRQTAFFDSLEYGGKTGSVDKDSIGRVDWFVGFARDPHDSAKRIAVGVVTVHGAYWTVHSSFIAAEYFRTYLKAIQKEQKRREAERLIVSSDTLKESVEQKARL